MKVFKFGGASVKNTKAIINVAKIVKSFDDPLIIVVSAIDKTTNALEEVWNQFVLGDVKKMELAIQKVVQFHLDIIKELELEKDDQFMAAIHESFKALDSHIKRDPSENVAFEYDQIVSFGELWSTMIISCYLNSIDLNNNWADARKLIRTTNHYQEARVNWGKTIELILLKLKSNSVENKRDIYITQGFIGHTDTGMTTTLGREGSDFSASILGWCVDAKEVIIWKDVEGVLNADPKEFDETIKLDRISYKEAIELSYFGASVIHPKTLKPLQNKNIPLRIKSFIEPDLDGTVIQEKEDKDGLHPCYIYNPNQLLLSISPKDFSFILEDHISEIFGLFSRHGLKVHLTQNSALSFSVCAKVKKVMLKSLINELSVKYSVKYNDKVDLLTIRHYADHQFPNKLKNKEILIKQRSRSTLRYVLR